jgi:hypothetical protein
MKWGFPQIRGAPSSEAVKRNHYYLLKVPITESSGHLQLFPLSLLLASGPEAESSIKFRTQWRFIHFSPFLTDCKCKGELQLSCHILVIVRSIRWDPFSMTWIFFWWVPVPIPLVTQIFSFWNWGSPPLLLFVQEPSNRILADGLGPLYQSPTFSHTFACSQPPSPTLWCGIFEVGR